MAKPFTLTPKKLNLLAVLAVAGVVISIVQTMHFAEVRSGQAAFKSFCTIGKSFDCNAIDASRYSELFAGIPLSAAAAGWWLAILAFALAARSAEFGAMLAPVLVGMTALGAAFSVAYLWIMVRVLQVGCLLCIGMDVVNFTAFAAMAHSWLRRSRDSHLVLAFRGPAIVAALSLLAGAVFAKGLQQDVPDAAALERRVDSILASQPESPNISNDLPSVGNPSAPVTIVKFSDFQCPSCRMGAQALHPVLKAHAGRVRFVYRNFPLDMSCNRMIQHPMHAAACELAKGALCAHAQGRFEEYYERIFSNQPTLKAGAALESARELGLDTARFEACLADPATTSRVLQDIEEGILMKVQSTPTFFVNGRRVEGALPPQAWNRLIESVLGSAK